MTTEIHNLIISTIKRSESGIAGAKTREIENDVSTINDNVAEKLTSIFKGGGMKVGGFSEDHEEDLAEEETVEANESRFVRHLMAHLDVDTFELNDFRELANKFAVLLALKLNTGQSKTAKDGFLVTYYFSHTLDIEDGGEESTSHYLCVVFLHRIKGEDIDEESMVFEAIERINLESLNLGAKVCINELLEPSATRPISFKLGRASEVSRFFKSFLGCHEPINSKDDTLRLRSAIEHSAHSFGMDMNNIEELCASAKSFCTERLASGETSVNLQALACYLFSDPEQASEFVETAHDDFRLGETVGIDKTELGKYTSFQAKTNDYTIKFSTRALTQNVDWNSESQTLTFRELPQTLIDQIIHYLPTEE